MSFARMMEKNLINHGFGMEEKVSEVDALVFADDQILMDRYNDKARRKDRIRNADLHARKLARCAVDNENRMVEIATHVGRDGVLKGHKVKYHGNYDKARYFVGDPKKGWSKKIRRERFSEPIIEMPRVCGVALDEDDVDNYLEFIHDEAEFYTHYKNTINDHFGRKLFWVDTIIDMDEENQKRSAKIQKIRNAIAEFEDRIRELEEYNAEWDRRIALFQKQCF